MKDNNNIELMTDYAIDVSESANGLCVLFKHDYFSSDNENGRSLIDKMIESLDIASDRIYLLIVTDSAVKLLESSDKFRKLITSVNTTLLDMDSAVFYGVSVDPFVKGSVHGLNMTEITDEIIESRPDLIIE